MKSRKMLDIKVENDRKGVKNEIKVNRKKDGREQRKNNDAEE